MKNKKVILSLKNIKDKQMIKNKKLFKKRMTN